MVENQYLHYQNLYLFEIPIGSLAPPTTLKFYRFSANFFQFFHNDIQRLSFFAAIAIQLKKNVKKKHIFWHHSRLSMSFGSRDTRLETLKRNMYSHQKKFVFRYLLSWVSLQTKIASDQNYRKFSSACFDISFMFVALQTTEILRFNSHNLII